MDVFSFLRSAYQTISQQYTTYISGVEEPERDLEGQTRCWSPNGLKDASKASKDLFASLISEHEISYEAVEKLLSAIKGDTFTPEDVKFKGLNGSVLKDFPWHPRPCLPSAPSQARAEADRLRRISSTLRSMAASHSEVLLASLVEDSSLSIGGFLRFLATIKGDTLELKGLNLESLESLIFHPIRMRQHALFENDRSSVSTSTIPHIVVQALIDMLADILPSHNSFDERIASILDGTAPQTLDIHVREAWRTLECMALVHPSWTSMVYPAMRRTLVVSPMREGERTSPWTFYIQNPLYGTWTQELVISITTGCRKFERPQRSFFLTNLHLRFPHLQMISIHFYRITEQFNDTLTILMGLKDLEELKIEVGQSSITEGALSRMPKSTYELLARFPRLRSLYMPHCPTRLQGLELPSEFLPLTTKRTFQRLQLNILSRRYYEDVGRPQNPFELNWIRQDGDVEDAFGLTSVQLRELSRSFCSLSGTDRRSLTALYAQCTGEVPWNAVDHDLQHLTSLREVEVTSQSPSVEVILASMPPSVESFTIAFPRVVDFLDVDNLLKSYIASGRFPSLKLLRVVRLYFKDKPYTYRRMKIPSSIPSTSKVCRERNIEHSAWF